MEKQYIYILGNTKNLDIIKVGETNRHPETRAIELTKQTGTIGKYFVEWSMEVPASKLAERVAHYKLKEFHFQEDKEQFEISAYDAHSILEQFIIPLFEIEKPVIFYSEALKKKIKIEKAKVNVRKALELALTP